MQEIHSMGGGGGRIFGGDRRLRPLPNQALKCPRCDSLNTKFCYYNNYNLSQPRHFCKNCRRYWTKGGVLRNVPVGGGCRKTKRSKSKPSSDVQKERKSNSHSSSESSSLTAATKTEAASVASSGSAAALLNFPDSRLFVSPNNFEPSMLDSLEQGSDGGIFMEAGSFTNLMTASNPPLPVYNFPDISSFRLPQQQQKMTSLIPDELKMQELTAGFLDQMVPDELTGVHNRNSNGGLTALDWQSGVDQGPFDQGYWSQSQWTESENDPTLYLP
ncbi:hypothetical protein HHK36_015538 [Tetracentron sinense]|uniref:Dof zinc finger protein n=1 Tax=Tetracentron sinense TaxID=13715 RepID=A0A834ZBW8_TETSI|nr:hypothetical protein HHK36_015538 [Tetracentron sinense]